MDLEADEARRRPPDDHGPLPEPDPRRQGGHPQRRPDDAEKTYVTQARLHTALIFFFTGKGKRIVGKAKRCTFDDKPDFQTCSVDVKNVGFIKIRAISTYKSQKGNSLAIAEIEPLKKS